jgi:hypothetical protein
MYRDRTHKYPDYLDQVRAANQALINAPFD